MESKKRGPSRASKPAAIGREPPVRSMRALAGVLSVSEGAVRKWIADPRWEFGGGPWNQDSVARIRAWRADNLQQNRNERPGPNSSDGARGLWRAISIARIKVLVERAANLQIERLIKEGKYVKRARLENAEARKFAGIRQQLSRLPAALRQSIADARDPAVVEDILTTALQQISSDAAEPASREEPGGPEPAEVVQVAHTT